MRAKQALGIIIFCLLLTGCQGKSTINGSASKESILLEKNYSWNVTENKYEKQTSSYVDDSDYVKKVENNINKIIILKELPNLTGKEIYEITIEKDGGGNAGYTLWKLSEDEYLVRTNGPIDTEKEWCIKDIDMNLKGVFDKYLK